MDIHTDSSEKIIAFLKKSKIEQELSKYDSTDLKTICDKIGLQRQGKVKLQKTFIKKISNLLKHWNNMKAILYSLLTESIKRNT